MANNFRCRCKRKRWDNDLIARTYPQGFKNKMHSGRCGCHRDGLNFPADKFCELPFKGCHLRSGGQPTTAENGNHRVDFFLTELKPKKGTLMLAGLTHDLQIRLYRRYVTEGRSHKAFMPSTLHSVGVQPRVGPLQLDVSSAYFAVRQLTSPLRFCRARYFGWQRPRFGDEVGKDAKPLIKWLGYGGERGIACEHHNRRSY